MSRLVLMMMLGVIACSDKVVVSTDASPPEDARRDGVVVDGIAIGDLATPEDLPIAVDLRPGPDITLGDIHLLEQGVGQCPGSEPVALSACSPNGSHCAYGSKIECGNIWECFESKWQLAYEGPDCATTSGGLCPASEPSSFCDATVYKCRYDTVQCTCQSVCSGPQPLPGQEMAWDCSLPQTVACPAKAPKLGDVCAYAALECTYGHCGPTIATCFGGLWDVVTLPPPP